MSFKKSGLKKLIKQIVKKSLRFITLETFFRILKYCRYSAILPQIQRKSLVNSHIRPLPTTTPNQKSLICRE